MEAGGDGDGGRGLLYNPASEVSFPAKSIMGKAIAAC